MSTSKISAWASWAEWRAVYDQLYSSNSEGRRVGVQRVATWRTRGRLPVAVDSTASFVEIMLNDPGLGASKTPRSEHELQLMYSMAVVRLVNGIVDVAQKNVTARSILMLAQDLDWPQWLVDLRHEATHNRLPSIMVLRLAAKEAVWLLSERFWRPQLAQLEQRGKGKEGAAPRDSRLLDRKIRAMSRLMAADLAGETHESSGKKDAAPALQAAQDFASLAADESRVLARLLSSTLAGEPNQEQAHMVRLLCIYCSDNFAARLARHILLGSLGLPSPKLESAADNAPSLRNLTDGNSRCQEVQKLEFKESLSDCETSQWFRWLQALLQPAATTGTKRPRSDSGRITQHLTEVAQHLQPLVLDGIAALLQEGGGAEQRSKDLQSRASYLWRYLAECRVGHSFSLHLLEAQEGAEPTSEPTLEEIHALLKRRRRGPQGCARARVLHHEPWTTLGTFFDESMRICSPLESRPGPELPSGGLDMWLTWAAEMPSDDTDLGATARSSAS